MPELSLKSVHDLLNDPSLDLEEVIQDESPLLTLERPEQDPNLAFFHLTCPDPPQVPPWFPAEEPRQSEAEKANSFVRALEVYLSIENDYPLSGPPRSMQRSLVRTILQIYLDSITGKLKEQISKGTGLMAAEASRRVELEPTTQQATPGDVAPRLLNGSSGPIVVQSIEEEYGFIDGSRCTCGGKFEPGLQFVYFDNEIKRDCDMVRAVCRECGRSREFRFDVSAFFPSHQGTPAETAPPKAERPTPAPEPRPPAPAPAAGPAAPPATPVLDLAAHPPEAKLVPTPEEIAKAGEPYADAKPEELQKARADAQEELEAAQESYEVLRKGDPKAVREYFGGEPEVAGQTPEEFAADRLKSYGQDIRDLKGQIGAIDQRLAQPEAKPSRAPASSSTGQIERPLSASQPKPSGGAEPPKAMSASERVKGLGCAVLALAVLAGVLWWVISWAIGDVRAKREKEGQDELAAERMAERTATARAELAKLIQTYNPVLVQQHRPGDFSANYSELLIRADRRPVMFLGSLEDVVALNGSDYDLLFWSREPAGSMLDFDLRCSTDVAKQVMQARSSSSWVVLATVSAVKPGDSDHVNFIAEGTCVALLPLDGTSVGTADIGD